jgi:hypothetical protein
VSDNQWCLQVWASVQTELTVRTYQVTLQPLEAVFNV